MVDLMLRRRQMMQAQGGGGGTIPWETNGLIFCLDGLTHDATSWTDLIGNVKYSPTNNPTYSWDNGLKFSSSSANNSYFSASATAFKLPSTATIEAVVTFAANPSGNYSILSFNKDDGTTTYGFIFCKPGSGNAQVEVSKDSLKKTSLATTDIHSIVGTISSSAQTGLYVNGVKKTTNGDYSTVSGGLVNFLGVYNTSSGKPMGGVTGTIHSVRVYNRVLTQAEIQSNYAVDVSRYNISV